MEKTHSCSKTGYKYDWDGDGEHERNWGRRAQGGMEKEKGKEKECNYILTKI